MKHYTARPAAVRKNSIPVFLYLIGAFAVIALVTPPLATAQTFPDREQLDVIDLTDGSALIGRLVDEEGSPLQAETADGDAVSGSGQPTEPIRIEIAGGSVFVIHPENVLRVRTIRNPDFGKGPDAYTVEPSAVLRAIYGEEAYPRTDEERGRAAGARAAKSDLANTTILGYYFAPVMSWHGGKDWVVEREALDGGVEQPQFIIVGETGFTVHHFFDPFGIRTSIGLIARNGEYDGEYQDAFDNTITLDHYEQYGGWAANLDFLLSTGPPRRRWYAGVGLGWLIPVYADSGYDGSELENPPLDEEFQDPALQEDPQPFGIYGTLSGGVLLAMGRSWTAEFRLAFDTSLTSIYPTRRVTASGVTAGFGVGYRLR